MFNRRKFLHSSFLGSLGLIAGRKASAAELPPSKGSYDTVNPAHRTSGIHPALPARSLNAPIVISTWGTGMEANKAAWQILADKGRALDAVEAGMKVIESSIECCVGLGANPDRDGFVTLDASIMDELGNCGSVGFLERIKHPISVARRIMEKTPYIMLVGSGAQEFALAEGFTLEDQKLSDSAKRAYEQWLKCSGYKPHSMDHDPAHSTDPAAHGPNPPTPDSGEWNHDTIGMIAIDAGGNLSGACSTSGIGFKMRGRVGDSPIIGAGLFVDNEIGGATSTGVGEETMRICGSHTVVQGMRYGLSPEDACRAAIERIARTRGEKAKTLQVAFLALSKNGEMGAFALQKGFTYALRTGTEERMVSAKSWF